MAKRKHEPSHPSRRSRADHPPRASTPLNSRPSSPTPYSQGQQRLEHSSSQNSASGNSINTIGDRKPQAGSSGAHNVIQGPTIRNGHIEDAHFTSLSQRSSVLNQSQTLYPYTRPNRPGTTLSPLKNRVPRAKGRKYDNVRKGPARKGTRGDDHKTEGEKEGDEELETEEDYPERKLRDRDHSPSEGDDGGVAA